MAASWDVLSFHLEIEQIFRLGGSAMLYGF